MLRERINQVKTLIKESGMDSLIVSSKDSIFYLTGIDIDSGERLITLVLTEEKEALLINALFPVKQETPVDIIYYSDTEPAVSILAGLMPKSQVVGIDKEWQSGFLLSLMEIKSDCKFKNGSIAVDRARLIKTENERELMREASRINDQVMGRVYDQLCKHPLSEIDMQDFVKKINQELGVHELSFTPLICYGENGAEPHHHSDNTILTNNQGIIIDIGGRKEGYCSDMTRSFFYGTPDDEYLKIYELVKEANLAAIKKVKPGVLLKDIDATAREIISNAGYGEFFTHRTGHGIGINVHEFPDVSSISDMVCEEGMIFSVEPGIYLKGKYGIRIEDLVMVTKDGYEVLNNFPKDLRVIIFEPNLVCFEPFSSNRNL